MDLADIRAEAEALERERALALLPSLAGKAAAVGLDSVFAGRRRAWDPEAFGLATGRLRAWCAAACDAARGREADQRRLSVEAAAVARLGDLEIPLREALASVPLEPRRDRRADLEAAALLAFRPAAGAVARRVEATMATARDLGFADLMALMSATEGFDPRALGEEAERFLLATGPAYADVLAWAFAREREVRPLPGGDAVRHDLERLLRLPRLDPDFRPGRARAVAERWLAMIGLDLRAEVELDEAARPGKALGAVVVPIEVPGRVALLWRPGGGAGEHLSLLGAAGAALHRALTRAELDFEDRWGGDQSVNEGYRALFSWLPLEDLWRARVLSAAPDPDATRLLALWELARLRQACAGMIHQLALYTEGPRASVDALYKEQMERAALVRWPEDFWALAFAPRLHVARELRGAALAASLAGSLRERFDEDWWRNPAFGAWLPRLFAVGQRDAPEVVARKVARDEKAAPSLAALSERMVRLLAEGRAW